MLSIATLVRYSFSLANEGKQVHLMNSDTKKILFMNIANGYTPTVDLLKLAQAN